MEDKKPEFKPADKIETRKHGFGRIERFEADRGVYVVTLSAGTVIECAPGDVRARPVKATEPPAEE